MQHSLRRSILFGFILLFFCFSHFASAKFLMSMRPERLMGSQIYIQIFKEEGVLELYVKDGSKFRLFKSYPICKYSGGLGPKKVNGDLQSPEGFYMASLNQLNPNSKFYKAINIGYPNGFDRAHGYSGNYLMIHGKCQSIGCYAMTDRAISEIYTLVEKALNHGQKYVPINIFPFRMTNQNMRRHKNSLYIAFWHQLKPGYDFFEHFKVPPIVSVQNKRYVITDAIEQIYHQEREQLLTKID